MNTLPPLRFVYLEDDDSAVELVRSLIGAEGVVCELVHAYDERSYREALAARTPDLILSDYNLPDIDGATALALRGELCPEAPFVFVSGALGEATAIDLLKAGATDFVLKDALPRLVPSVRRCLAEAAIERDRRRAQASLRESEARFRRLAENAPDVIFRYALDTVPGRCEFISAAVERITGYRPEDFYADPNFPVHFVHPDDRHLVLAIVERREIPAGAAEIRWIARDGRTIVTDQRFVPVFDDEGRLVALEGVARDVTQVKNEAERRRQLEAQLHQAQKMESIGTLAGGIAHDFNNILTGILGFAEIAGYSLGPNDPAREAIEEIRKAGLRARDLVAQILTFSRQKEIQLVPLDLARAVGDALKFLRASVPATIAIERRLVSGMVNADPTQIHQIVLNLCTNAVHAMGAGPGTLYVAVEPVELDAALAATMPKVQPGPHVCLLVRDTGHGMDAEMQRRIFEPFFTTKQPGEGTGLGLPVVLGIVGAHGGGLALESAPGVGTTFRLYFPAATAAAPVQEVAQPVESGRGERILVVDDETSIGSFAAVRLEQQNYRAFVYDDPRRALAAVRAAPRSFDAVVTDLAMPGMTGLDLLRAIRAEGANLPAVVVTGNREVLPPRALEALPRTVLVEKPFTGNDLARALRGLLRPPSSPP
jgi:PAS domain S-box-containing protein